MTEIETYDAIVVGARCAGATVATLLARGGWRVALVDRDRFPSDAISTHTVFPDALAELERLGAMDLLRARHDLAPARYSWRVLGQAVAGAFTPSGGHDRCLSVRRISLDAVLVDLAHEAGADLHLGQRVTEVLGAGTADDPARGVVLDDGRVLGARWVLAADGQRSTVARRLGLPAEQEMRGEMAFLLAYWTGLPRSEWCHLDVHADRALMSVPCEDGVHLLSVAGRADLTRGTPEELEERYHALLGSFPGVLNPRLLAGADRISKVVAAPETMMRGYFRPAAGPGWATLGDAGHLKHPATAQGIGDALAQARYVAEHLLAGGDLGGYADWRAARAAEHYEWSFMAARFPGPAAEGLYAGIAADPDAAQGFLDSFTKRTRPSDVLTAERTARWRMASAYEDGLRRVVALVEGVEREVAERTVPACPDWSVRDLVAHLAGVAEDSTRGGFFPAADRAWADADAAVARERWTAGHTERRRRRTTEEVLSDLAHHGRAYVAAVRRGDGPALAGPPWMLSAPLADLSAHLEDLREALGVPPEPDAEITRTGFGVYRAWLDQRLVATGAPALGLSDGDRTWVLGGTEPAATLTATRAELFRIITGRRSEAAIRAADWDGDPGPYLGVLSPYPLPA
ncbi:uncharacterized protein (TIGR03083 family) [Nocardioides thalensis]|uniref:Uncharacterized protein (TIGR03083 family) n=1 Tax=Nocardioides thalensis TaxID=1914755 RepID=A0A853BX75_9ACTN|nr:uncharacterized protein (TIGR03083 family) [Nocardioides thalensis]